MNASTPHAALVAADSSHLSALPIIEKWVSFDTVSRDSNLALLDWTEAYLSNLGIQCSRTYDDTGLKANLWATLPAHNGETKVGGIVLSGHTDVVPIDGQAWDTDPFKVEIKDGKAFGRGVTDMKSFGATALMMVPELLKRKLKQPVHLAFSYDEEVGCIGVRRMIAQMVAEGYRPAGCIVGEPTKPPCMDLKRTPHSHHWALTR